MSAGMNKAFAKDPEKFLREYPMDVPPYDPHGKIATLSKLPDTGGPAAGVHAFDLWPDPKTGLVVVMLDAERVEGEKKPEPAFLAYWLPWNPDGEAGVTFEELNAAGATYLFTHSLAGCRILVTPTGFHHISGQLSQVGREEATQEITGGGRARSFSSTTGTAYGDGAFIVGHRAKQGFLKKRTGDWEFIGQSAAMAYETRRYAIQKVWSNSDLFLIGR